jgi:pimeloyl-ACP methyl ester carboxylesterase
VIWGRRDPVIPLRIGRRIERLIPGARLTVFECGHVPHTSQPEEFARELLAFADEVFATPDAQRRITQPVEAWANSSVS